MKTKSNKKAKVKKKANCKARNLKKKCLVYTKVHTNKEAEKKHLKALKKRGAKIKIIKRVKGVLLEYSFPKK